MCVCVCVCICVCVGGGGVTHKILIIVEGKMCHIHLTCFHNTKSARWFVGLPSEVVKLQQPGAGQSSLTCLGKAKGWLIPSPVKVSFSQPDLFAGGGWLSC